MSVVRWAQEGSNLFIIGTGGGWECVGCDEPNAYNQPLDGMLAHIKAHRLDPNCCVPPWLEDKLRRDDKKYMQADPLKEAGT